VEKIKKWVKKDKWIIAISLIIGIIAAGFTYSKSYSQEICDGLKQKIIRFHVIANSDSEQDQSLKLKVRDAVLEEMKPILEKSKSIEESREIIKLNKDKIKQIAEKVIKDYGKDYKVEIKLENAEFPTKQYGDIVLPAGEYEAVRIIIGDGGGKNWWCVMFPPLCFVDITHGTVPEENKKEFEKLLEAEEYKIIAEGEELDIKVKFKIVEWWQEKKQKHQQEEIIYLTKAEKNDKEIIEVKKEYEQEEIKMEEEEYEK